MAERIDITDGGRNPLRVDRTFAQPVSDDRSITELLRELSREAGNLVRGEAELAKAEVREKVSVYRKNIAGIAIGGALLLTAVLLVVAAANNGLTALLEGIVGLETAVWLAPLLLAAFVALIGYALLTVAMARIREEGIQPHETVATLKDDVRWIERKVRS